MDAIYKLITNFHPNPIMIFGVLLLFGVAGGMIANRIKWMPTITAFMTLGALIGPHAAGLITKNMLDNSAVLIDIALGLILYRLGNMLHPKAMLRSKRLMITSSIAISLTFCASFILVLFLGRSTPVAALIAAIAISSSPAVLVHVSEELGAKGIITERAKSLVALNNLSSFLIFSLALPFAMVKSSKSLADALLVPLYGLLVGAIIGVVVGWMAIRITRLLGARDEHYRFVIVIGAVMLTLGLASTLGASLLFAPLVLGVATRGFETSKSNLSRVGLGEGMDLFYIILFVMAGAKIDFHAVIAAGMVPVMLALVRSLGIFVGIFAAARFTGHTVRQSLGTSLLLIPMAGMAIGLVATTNNLVPEMGATIAAIVYAMIAIFETIGPFAATRAFLLVGEAGKLYEEGKKEDPKKDEVNDLLA